MDLLVVIVSPSLSAVGSWEEVLLFSMDFTMSQNFLELELQDTLTMTLRLTRFTLKD
jgi:hypothetical protein